MATIQRQPLTTNYNYNQIGHFKELVAGAGSKVFKVNSAGIFAGASSYGSAPFQLSYSGALTATGVTISGAITATSGTFTGTIHAQAGDIMGNLDVTGELTFKHGSSERGKIYCDADWMYLTGNGGHGLKILESTGDVYIPDDSLYVYNEIVSQHGSIYAYNDVYSTHGSVYAANTVYAVNSIYSTSGDLTADGGSIRCLNDITSSNGTCHAKNGFRTSNGSIWALNNIESYQGAFKCKGYTGWDKTYTVVTWISGSKFYTHDLKFKGGIFYGESGEDSHNI